ncbi:hypothetical protein BDV10DRAFT_179560 [Aspergillus recurvatus]
MLANFSINVCICVASVFTILFSKPIIGLIKQGSTASASRRRAQIIAIAKSSRLLGCISQHGLWKGFG